MYKNYNFTRHLLACLILVMTAGAASAQYNELKFGIQVSPTFSGMTTNNNLINRDGSNLGLKLGLLGEYYISETYSIHTGLGFHFNAGGTLFYEDQFDRVDIWQESLDGALTTAPDSIAGGIGFKYDLQYVEIPLGLTLRTREFGYLRYYVRPAIHLGILTQSRGSVKGAGFVDEEESFDISKETNSLNLGWSIGAGVEYSLSESTALVAGLAFQSGFADVTTDNGTSLVRSGRQPAEDDSRGKINSIVIMLGVMF